MRKQYATEKAFAAPYGGLNCRDAYPAMSDTQAIWLDNFFPAFGCVQLRDGSYTWATGTTGNVNSLIGYGGNGITSSKLFAGTLSGKIYDVTVPGAVGASVVTGLNGTELRSTQFGGASETYLVAVNGVDPPQFYDGATWTYTGAGGYATNITVGGGAINLDFVNVCSYGNRLWFVQNNSARVLYLGMLAIGGAGTYLDLGALLTRGGKIVAAVPFVSTGGGSDLGEFIAFLSSEGEAIVYGGLDPATASFALVGRFRIGRPIGYNCVSNLGGEAFVLTYNGVATLASLISGDPEANWGSVCDLVRPWLSDDALAFGALPGWSVVYAPARTKLVVNVPQAGGLFRQYIMNTATKSWCTFTGWNTPTMCYYNSNLWGSEGTTTYKLDVPGYGDKGTAVSFGSDKTATCLTAYQDQLNPVMKQFTMCRPIMTTSGLVSPLLALSIDYVDATVYGSTSYTATGGAIWGTDLWGTGVFGVSEVGSKMWVGVRGIGITPALRFKVTGIQHLVKWHGWQLLYNRGGVL